MTTELAAAVIVGSVALVAAARVYRSWKRGP